MYNRIKEFLDNFFSDNGDYPVIIKLKELRRNASLEIGYFKIDELYRDENNSEYAFILDLKDNHFSVFNLTSNTKVVATTL